MRPTKTKIILPVTVFLFLSGFIDVHAQLLKKAAQKISTYKNISYTDIVGMKFSFMEEFSTDTIESQLFLVSEEPSAGGYYRVKGSTNSYAFDGNKMINLNLSDSTYKVEKQSVVNQHTRTLLYWKKKMEELSLLPSGKIKQLTDTLINNIAYSSIRVTESDTVKSNIHHYSITNFIIDKKNNLPIQIIRRLMGNADDGSIMGAIEKHTYANYKLNQKNFPNLSVASIPNHFKLPLKRVPVVFLQSGTSAPAILARDPSGNLLNLEKLKGKMVLLNFSSLGCPHCVAATQMLNRLHDKYKEKDLIIVNIYPIDQKEAIVKFDKKENVKSTSYISDKTVQKAYPYDGYPSFYLLDKNGVVAQSYEGYFKDLESQLTEKIESINKNTR